jgi:LysM repeat protein
LSDLHRDDSCGYEAVTAPVAGDYLVKCIESLGKVFEKSRVRVDNRCSIHTHVDAKDLQWADMFRFLTVYSKVEPILYLIAGQERLGNRYAVPIGKEYAAALERTDKKDAIMSVAFTTLTREGRKSEVNMSPGFGKDAQKEKPGRRADNHPYCRRKGLNILPWLAGRGPRPRTPVNVPILNGDSLEKIAQRHGVSVAALMRWNKTKQGAKLVPGRFLIVNKRTIAPDTTVEFRIHPNTTDAQRVINWAKLMVRLVDWAAKSTDKDLENLPKSPLRILCQNVAPELAPWIMSRVKEWRHETSRRNGLAQRLISLKGGKYVY